MGKVATVVEWGVAGLVLAGLGSAVTEEATRGAGWQAGVNGLTADRGVNTEGYGMRGKDAGGCAEALRRERIERIERGLREVFGRRRWCVVIDTPLGVRRSQAMDLVRASRFLCALQLQQPQTAARLESFATAVRAQVFVFCDELCDLETWPKHPLYGRTFSDQ